MTISKRGAMIAMSVMLLIIAATATLLVLGVLRFQKPGHTVASASVCGADIIDQINAINSGNSDASADDLMKTIKAKNNYDEDPTCAMILFANAWGNYQPGDSTADLKYYQQLLGRLSDAGAFPSNKVENYITPAQAAQDLNDVD
ncbi:MAG: hypothetical protein LBM73_01165 [Candidatus Nomurabacteria bacterium]|nr:hypothetical protein [Candidatus Nomurabacteria bacterium]